MDIQLSTINHVPNSNTASLHSLHESLNTIMVNSRDLSGSTWLLETPYCNTECSFPEKPP